MTFSLRISSTSRASVSYMAIVSASVFLAFSGAASAQDIKPTGVTRTDSGVTNSGMIIVTARKREETLQEVPISITAFSSEDIKKQGLIDMRDISSRTPSLQYAESAGIAGGGRTNPNLTFRGMQNLTPVPQDQSASAFLDGMFLTGGPQAVTTIDVERVEVLKGPQSTYFGRATFGGAVNFITKTPGFDFKTEVQGQVATYETYALAVANEGPLIDNVLAYRVSVSGDQQGPMYQSSADGGDLGRESTLQGNLSLLFTPGPSTSVKLRISAQQIKDSAPQTTYLKALELAPGNCDGFTWSGFDRDGNPAQNVFDDRKAYFCVGDVPSLGQLGEGVMSGNTSLNSPYYTANPNDSNIPALAANGFTLSELFVDNILGDPFVAQSPRLNRFGLIRNDFRSSLAIDHEFDSGISVATNFSYSKARGTKIYDYDNNRFEGGYGIIPLYYQDFSAEFRVVSNQANRFRWLFGANYYDGTVGYDFTGSTMLRSAFGDFTGNSNNYTKFKSIGIFGSLEYDIFENLTVAIENRYMIDEETIVRSGVSSGKFKDWAPRAIVQFRPTDDLNIYASYSIGILPGRNNVGYINATPAERALVDSIFGDRVAEVIPSDKLKNYEAGIKGNIFGGSAQFALTGYYAVWENKKISLNVVLPGQLLPNIAISGELEMWGLEFEGGVNILNNWRVGGTFALNKTKNVTIFNESEGRVFGSPNFKGKREPRNPEVTWTLNTDFTTPLKDDWDLFVFGEGIYRGAWFGDNANIMRFSPRFVANLRFGVDRGDLRFEAFVTNLFNDKNWSEGQRLVDIAINPDQPYIGDLGALVQAPDKRQFGLRATMAF